MIADYTIEANRDRMILKYLYITTVALISHELLNRITRNNPAEMLAQSCIVPIPENSHFTTFNLPFGCCKTASRPARPCSAIGDYIIDLEQIAASGLFDAGMMREKARHVFGQETLNPFMSLGRAYWRETRVVLQRLLTLEAGSPLEGDETLKNKILIPRDQVEMILPINVGDYTDFYSSREHAVNVGTMFRGKDNALQPNWFHYPLIYSQFMFSF